MKRTFFLLFAAMSALAAQPVFAQDRVALLIVNSAYPGDPAVTSKSGEKRELMRLNGVEKDGPLMKESLIKTGFQVELLENLTSIQMKTALQGFAKKHAAKREVLFYFSGHGFHLGGANFLAGVDTDIDTSEEERDAETRLFGAELEQEKAQIPLRAMSRPKGGALPLELVVANLAAMRQPSAKPSDAKKNVRIVLIDACRNQLPKTEPGTVLSKGEEQLAKKPGMLSQAIEPGMFIGFSALNGRVSFASPNGPSLFTKSIAERMLKPGRMVDVFKDARVGVENALRDLRVKDPTLENVEQIPSYTDQLRSEADFAFVPSPNPDEELAKLRAEAARIAAEREKLAAEKAQTEAQQQNVIAQQKSLAEERMKNQAERKDLEARLAKVAAERAEPTKTETQPPSTGLANTPESTPPPPQVSPVTRVQPAPSATPRPAPRKPQAQAPKVVTTPKPKPSKPRESEFERALRESQNR